MLQHWCYCSVDSDALVYVPRGRARGAAAGSAAETGASVRDYKWGLEQVRELQACGFTLIRGSRTL